MHMLGHGTSRWVVLAITIMLFFGVCCGLTGVGRDLDVIDLINPNDSIDSIEQLPR